MRTIVIACAALLLATASLAATTGSSATPTEKFSRPTGVPTYEGRDPGDTIEDPIVISVPNTLFGNTCPFIDDYDEVCPWTGSTAPDVVYKYVANHTSTVIIDLCTSQYDTKVFVYENEYTPGAPYACNDDSPGCGPMGYRSWLMMECTWENTYYIVIDGYYGSCGDYVMYIEEYLPCTHCDPGGLGETEPHCMDPTNDVDNGGCNSDPPVFDYLHPSAETVYFCGTSGTYNVGGQHYRDTDWYQIDLAAETEITLEAIANFDITIGFVDGREGCEGAHSFYSYTNMWTCGWAELTEILPAGTWWLWIGPTDFEYVNCGAEYECWLDGYTPVTAVEDASWSAVKAIFR
jgi:hypothetical protein